MYLPQVVTCLKSYVVKLGNIEIVIVHSVWLWRKSNTSQTEEGIIPNFLNELSIIDYKRY